MNKCFVKSSKERLVSIVPVKTSDFIKWMAKQSQQTKNWAQANNFTAKVGSFCIIPDKQGNIEKIIVGALDENDFWSFSNLQHNLPNGNYTIDAPASSIEQLNRMAIAWGIGSYKFSKYKKSKPLSKLLVPKGCDYDYLNNLIDTIHWIEDLINLPADDLGPEELAKEASDLAKKFNAKIKHIVGEQLIKQNYPAIYAVGKGSLREPRLVDLRWENGGKKSPKITLVGKGVCFDSGGLSLKPSKHMYGMNKDMAGAAHVLGLARMIMHENLPINLRVIVPIVENLVSHPGYKPGDVLTMRNGKTTEVANTDAEGRLILADALSLATEEEKPDILLDFASLTGAARVALGMDITAMFTDDEKLANDLMLFTQKEQEPLWRMPLYHPYAEYLHSKIANLSNVAPDGAGGGAITAALFLKEFVPDNVVWAHFDLASASESSRKGKHKSGDVYCLRGIFNYLKEYCNKKSLQKAK